MRKNSTNFFLKYLDKPKESGTFRYIMPDIRNLEVTPQMLTQIPEYAAFYGRVS